MRSCAARCARIDVPAVSSPNLVAVKRATQRLQKWPQPLEIYNDTRYTVAVIRSLGDRTTEDIFDGVNSREARRIPNTVWKAAQRKMALINNAGALNDIAALPGNRLEKLFGKWAGFYSIRINDQYRIAFRWDKGQADEVQIVDYH